MSSVERALAFSERIREAFAELGPGTPLCQPGNPSEPVQVCTIPFGEADSVLLYAVFAVADFADFTPLAFTNHDPHGIAVSLLALMETAWRGHATGVGSSYPIAGSEYLRALDIGGLVLLTASTLHLLADRADETTIGTHRFEPRLVVYVSDEELQAARTDFGGLMDRWDAAGRDVFLLRETAED